MNDTIVKKWMVKCLNSLRMTNKCFKILRWKTNFMQTLDIEMIFYPKKKVNLYINKCQFENSLFPITYLHNVRPKKKS